MTATIHHDGVHARAWGDPAGRPILLVHGVSGTSWDWTRSVMRMSQSGGYLVALDLPGFGDSDWLSAGEYSVPHLSSMLERFADTVFGGRRYAYVGHSYGGKMGIVLAGASDSKVSDLLLVDNGTDLGPGSPAVRERLKAAPVWFPDLQSAVAGYRASYAVESIDVFLLRMSQYLRSEPDGGFSIRRDPRFIDQMVVGDPQEESAMLRSRWTASSARARIIRAEKSRMLTAETVDWMLATSAGSSAVVAPAVGHNVLSEAPEVIAGELDRLLSQGQTPAE